MSFSQGSKTLDLDKILSSVREFDILSHYIGISNIPCIIKSPLRIDNNPSFGLYSKNGDNIYYHDFATKERGGTFQLMMKLWGLSYSESLNKIANELPTFKINEKKISLSNIKTQQPKTHKKEVKLKVKVRPIKNHDIEYWAQYGITEYWLKFGDIYPISHLIFTKNGNTYNIPAEKHAYAYIERKDSTISIKAYQPFSKKFKWANTHDSSVWDLWTKLPETGDKLIITSSRKDALCIWSNTGIPSISLQAESYLPKKHVVDQLKARFDKVYVLYDNDFHSEKNNGRLLGEAMAKEFDLIQIEIPSEYKSKDSSDLYKNYGKHEFENVIHKLLETL